MRRPDQMSVDLRKIAAIFTVVVGFVLLYWRVLVKLVSDWWTDGNYSHGFFIIPIAAYLAWERREKFRAAAQRPTVLGLFVIIGSVIVLAGGVLGSELFLTRISILGTATGIVLFFFGWARLRVLLFPMAFLFLMIPLPAIIFNQIAFPLQLVASQFGEKALNVADIPVLREGNVLVLANTTLEVAEACSGIRSLISLLTLGIVFGYFADSRMWVRTVIALSSVPVAIVANGARVAGTGIAAHFIGPAAAEGFFHEFSGWIIFIAAFAMMLAIQRAILVVAPPPAIEKAVPAAA
jgi:exosortase